MWCLGPKNIRRNYSVFKDSINQFWGTRMIPDEIFANILKFLNTIFIDQLFLQRM